MNLRRFICFLLALSFFICGAFSVSVYAATVELEYNGVLLPDISSVWDKDNYSYVFIAKPIGSTYYSFYQVSKIPVVVDDEYNGEVLRASDDGSVSLNLIQYKLWSNASEWDYSTNLNDYSNWFLDLSTVDLIYSNFDMFFGSTLYFPASSPPVDPNAPVCSNIDRNCDNICDECGGVLSVAYWSTALEYLVTLGYEKVDQTSSDYFCILYNTKDLAPELITGETKFEINSTGDVLLTKNPQLYKLFEWENGSFSHYSYEDVSKTSDGLYIDPLEHEILRVLYSNHSVENRYVYTPNYDPFGGGETVGGGSDREQATRFDIDLDTYKPLGGLPADPEFGSGRVDVVVSPSAPPVSVPISPTSPVVTPTPDPVPVVTPTPDPSDPNSIIIQNQITNIGNDLAALPDKVGEKITDKIGDSIKGLFIPSETDIVAIKEKWTMLLSERFGAVYESTTVLDGVFDAFVFDAVQPTFTFPTIELEFSGVPFVLGGWEVRLIPKGFDFVVPIIKTITNISLTLVFINAMRKKYEKVVHH